MRNGASSSFQNTHASEGQWIWHFGYDNGMSRKTSSASSQQLMRLIEPGVTLFRPAEIPVVSPDAAAARSCLVR